MISVMAVFFGKIFLCVIAKHLFEDMQEKAIHYQTKLGEFNLEHNSTPLESEYTVVYRKNTSKSSRTFHTRQNSGSPEVDADLEDVPPVKRHSRQFESEI